MTAPVNPFDALTARELEVARLLVMGSTCREISAMLGCSIRTIDTHRAHVLDKLGVSNVVKLVWLALEHGEAQAPVLAPR